MGKLDCYDIQQKFVQPKGLPVKCLIYWPNSTREAPSEVGTWFLPGGLIDNFKEQESIGWQIMIALKQGAEKIEIVVGNVNFDLKKK